MDDEPIQVNNYDSRKLWIDDHDGADKIIYDPETNQPFSAIYFYPNN